MITTTARSQSLGAGTLLLCAVFALVPSVAATALPVDTTHLRQRDTSCAARYGWIQVTDPNNPSAPSVYLDAASDDGQFFTTSSMSVAGIFKYTNCEGYDVADLECINYAGPYPDYRLLGLAGPADTTPAQINWSPIGVNHIGGTGPWFFSSEEEIPEYNGYLDVGDYASESAVWSFASDGTTLITRFTQQNLTYTTANPYWNEPNAVDFHTGTADLRTLKFVSAKLAFGQTCYEASWSDKAPCQVGTCTQLRSYTQPAGWTCL